MALYITSDVATTGTVDFADGTTTSIPFSVTANAVTFVQIPANQFLGAEGQFLKGIHITALKPIAVYGHIYASSVSGATLLLPVSTLGKNYYSLNYTQISNAANSYSTFIVIATEDNTSVEITPSADLNSGIKANATFTVTLKKGELYQGLSATDLTGTLIKSVSNADGTCKRIAVFSGSSKIGIGCAPLASLSSDNLFQQVYPTSAWGKNYITVALKNRPYDIFRIVLSDPATNVTLNGAAVPLTKFTGMYYEFNTNTTNSVTNYITSDKPIQVIQYSATQNQTLAANCKATTGDVGDPEMIYLSPIEQGLDHVTLYSTGYYNILQSYINVVLPTSAVSSFKLDGASYTSFTPVTSNTSYSYAQIPVTSGPVDPAVKSNGATLSSGTHNIAASVPFNAIAYGFGSTESYGYAAGTNLQDLNEFIALQNSQTQAVSTSAACLGATYNIQISLPYVTNDISWDFKDGTTPFDQQNPQPVGTTVKGTQTLYVYQYPNPVTYTSTGDHTIIATVSNPTSDDCGTTENIEIDYTVSDVPTAAFTNSTTLCLGSAVTFTDKTDTKNVTTKSWAWDFGDATNATTANPNTATTQNPTHTYIQPGDYTVTLTITNTNGCSSATTGTIHINKLPVAGFTIFTPDCATQVVTFADASTSAEGAITSWAWDFGAGGAVVTKTDNSNVTNTYAAAGTYHVTLTVTTAGGCTNTYTHDVVVLPLPVVDFTLPTTCLANSVAQFTDATTDASATGKPFKYLWNFGDVNATATNPNTSTLQNPTHQFTAGGTYHVSLTVTSNDNCTPAIPKTHDYIVSGIAKFSAAATACPGDQVIFTDQTDPSGTVATAWQWDFGDGSTSTLQNPQHAFALATDYIVTLTVSGNNGCSVTSYSKRIHINKLATASFTSTKPDCETQSITFTDTSTPGDGTNAKWAWDFGDGTTEPVHTDNKPFTHTFATAGTYNVSLAVTSSTGCVSPATVDAVTVNPVPVVDFSLPDACLFDNPQFNDLSTIADHTESNFTYLWNFGDKTPTSTLKNPTHKYAAAGTYTITLTVTSKYGCIVTQTKQFTVNGASPVAAFSTTASTYCSSDPVVVNNNSSVSIGKITRVVMYWDYNGDQTNQTTYTQDPVTGLVPATFTHNYGTFNTPGLNQNYALKMAAYSGSANGCFAETVLQNITIKPNPIIEVTQVGSICENSGSVQINVTNSHGFTGTAVFSGTGVSSTGLFNPMDSGAGAFTITCTYTANGSNCSYITTQKITVLPYPTVNVGLPVSVLEGGTVTIYATASGDNLTYKWTLSDGVSKAVGLNHDDVLQPVASPATDEEYKLTVTNGEGCQAVSSVIKVAVLKAPVVPNTFTPNNDGNNDTWKIDNLSTYPNCTVEVFNRNGTLLFQSVGYPIPWDGKYKGADLPVGVYYYIINPKNGRKTMSGSITIIR